MNTIKIIGFGLLTLALLQGNPSVEKEYLFKGEPVQAESIKDKGQDYIYKSYDDFIKKEIVDETCSLPDTNPVIEYKHDHDVGTYISVTCYPPRR